MRVIDSNYRKRREEINLNVESPIGNFLIAVRTDMKVGELIELIEQRMNANPENAYIYYKIQKLDFEKTLDYYNIFKDTTIKFIF